MVDEFDRVSRRVLWSLPSGLYVVGSSWGERRNAMTLNQAIQISSVPKIIAIGVAHESLTAELIGGSNAFSLNLLARSDSAIVRKFVKPVAVDSENKTLNGFLYHERSTGAPILSRAVAYLDCRLVGSHAVGDHQLFLGEIVDAGFQGPEDTPILRMEDTRMHYGG